MLPGLLLTLIKCQLRWSRPLRTALPTPSKTSIQMLLTVSHNTASQDITPASIAHFGKVNLSELYQVRRDYLPSMFVKLTPLTELERRAAELCREMPRLAEEAAFVVHEEKTRRLRLAASPLHITL